MKANTAQEIRIGNILLSPNTDRYVVIELDHIIYIAKEQPFSTSEYKPIPLTEEWLLKFGFENGRIPAGLPAFRHPKLDATLVYYDGSFGIAGAKTQPPLDYVHQLQNLFFALTGTELTITK